MKIRILSVGKVKEDFYRNRIKEYRTIIEKKCSFEIIEVEDEKTAEHMSELEIQQVQNAEGERLLKYLGRNTEELVIALCIDGTMYATREWNQKLRSPIQQGEIRQITYIIGGSLGLAANVIQRADFKLSFSGLTFPHQLMRVLLTEQIAGFVETL